MKNILLVVLLAAVTTLIIIQWKGQPKELEPITTTDTIYITQTVRDTIPKLIYRTIKEVRIDTVYTIDSIPTPILLPLEELTYSNTLVTEKEDTIEYRANISGYKASLDSIGIRMKYKQLNTTILQSSKENWKDRFGLGLQMGVGYGITNKRPDIYVGFGISYKIHL